jgi:hypothetical protein
MQKTYTVKLEFSSLIADSPLDVAKVVAEMIQQESTDYIYDVEDEDTGEKFTVDLSEDDEDAVLPND